MRIFEADSTASYRLTKIAYLKLYNKLAVRKAVDLLFQAYAERGLKTKQQSRPPSNSVVKPQAAEETAIKS